jgi:hypothetical protein
LRILEESGFFFLPLVTIIALIQAYGVRLEKL